MKTVFRLLTFLIPFIKALLLSLLLSTVTIAANIGLMGTSAYLISAAALHPSIADLQVAIVGVRFFGIARAGLRYAERLVSHSLNFHILAKMRVWFYTKLEPLALARLLFSRSGDVLTSAVADIETLEDFYIRVVSPPMVALLTTIGMGFFIGAIHPALILPLVIGLLLCAFGLPVVMYVLVRKTSRVYIDQRAEMNSWIMDTLQGLDVLTAYGETMPYLKGMEKINLEFGRTQMRLAMRSGMGSGLNLLLSNGTIWVLLFTAIPLVALSQINGVLLAVVVLASVASLEAATPMPVAAQKLEGALAAAGRLFRLEDQKPAVSDLCVKPLLVGEFQSLSLRNMSFHYSDDLPDAVTNISLDLPAGKHIAIVGPSGSGKTTIANLLQRFWDIPDGQIFLNGNEIHSFYTKDVRGLFAVVSQTTDLFTLTVRQNLLLAHPETQENDLWKALERSQLDAWVHSLPQGLDTWLGDRSLQMSGGERQRLAIARAILQDSPIFLLDEPTANLDALTEESVLTTIKQITSHKTLLWITHRMKGLENLDEIIVLDKGSILERGRHDDLIKMRGLYYRMWTTQNQMID